MTIQWVAISYFLYSEIVITLLLILPIIRPCWWKKVFNLKIFSSIKPIWNTIFYALLVILILLFLDSIRMQMKYSPANDSIQKDLSVKLDRQLRECKGQRNYYITGFALFLILVIRRLVHSISKCATLEASHQALTVQANNLTTQLSESIGRTSDGGKSYSKEEYEKLQTKLKSKDLELEAMKKQAESTSREYDRMSSEFQKLQNKEAASDEGKKDV